jgi:hypothetical protein
MILEQVSAVTKSCEITFAGFTASVDCCQSSYRKSPITVWAPPDHCFPSLFGAVVFFPCLPGHDRIAFHLPEEEAALPVDPVNPQAKRGYSRGGCAWIGQERRLERPALTTGAPVVA